MVERIDHLLNLKTRKMEQSEIQKPRSKITRRPVALVILEGWGYSPQKRGNAIAQAHTPYYDEILQKYPNTTLAAAGLRVGLALDAVGNSEVGHLTMGSGRIVRTDVTKVSDALRSGRFFENEVLKNAFAKAKFDNSSVHLVGLLSDGDVHSSSRSLFALLSMAKKEGAKKVFVHAILDGRNVEQRTADTYVEVLEIKLAEIGNGEIASLCGRHYAMDRDENWERTARYYNTLVHGEGERATDAVTAVRSSFLRGIADEFIQPIILEKSAGEPVAMIKDGDLVIFFNHRADRMKQIVKSLAIATGDELGKPNIEAVCLIEYDPAFELPVAFGTQNEKNVLANVFEENGIVNCRIVESYNASKIDFFNGGNNVEFQHELRLIVQSATNISIEAQPELSSFKVTDAFLESMESMDNDVFIINLGASDMVAQSGNLEKTIESIQFVDTCIGGIVEKIGDLNGVTILTSDHGNCEEMIDLLTGEPHHSNTANQVPFVVIDEDANGVKLRENGSLEDVAPTILAILGIEKPLEMTGSDLRC